MKNKSNEKYEISNLGDVILKLCVGIGCLFTSYEIFKYLNELRNIFFLYNDLRNCPSSIIPPLSVYLSMILFCALCSIFGTLLIWSVLTGLEFRKKHKEID